MKGIKPTWRSKPCSKESALADSGRAMFSSGFPQFRPRSSLLTSWKILNERSKKLKNVYREKNSLYRDKEQWKDWKKIRNNNKRNPISTKTKFVKATFISQETQKEKAKLSWIHQLGSYFIFHNLENKKIHE